mgnify:CR=1 FL=1
MCDPIRYFDQKEYNRVLDSHGARIRGLSQGECESLLMDHGASYQQAKNGAYVYLHHGGGGSATSRTSQDEYARILNRFGAVGKTNLECVNHLQNFGFTYGQAKSAVYKYRQKRGLIRK